MKPPVISKKTRESKELRALPDTEAQTMLPFPSNGSMVPVPSSKVRRPQNGEPFAWAHTYTAFSLSFAKAALAHLGVTSTSSVIDPFVGSGTTMLAAAMYGCH